MSSENSSRRIDCLDGLRAIAAAMVMLFHFNGYHEMPTLLAKASNAGKTGVDLFFVLSGFLITRILLETKNAPDYFRTFYARRTLRIFPLYYGFLIFYFFALPAILGQSITPFKSQWWCWFYLQNIPATFQGLATSGPGHFWTLAIEEQFYLFWPFLVFILSRKQFGISVIACLLIPVATRFFFMGHEIIVYYFTFTRIDGLAFGALLSLMLSSKARSPLSYASLFRKLLVVIPFMLFLTFTVFKDESSAWRQTLKFSLIPAFYFALIGFCIVDPAARRLNDFLSLKFLRWLGMISYGLYVFHPTCFELIHRFVPLSNFFLDVTFSFAVAAITAYLSYRFFELPILKLKNKYKYENPSGNIPIPAERVSAAQSHNQPGYRNKD